MKQIYLMICIVCCTQLHAQSRMFIHNSDNTTLGVPLSAIDSISLHGGSTSLFIRTGTGSSEFPISAIDSISFNGISDTVFINYNGNSVSVVNPLAFENVTVSTDKANVIISSSSGVKNIIYKISGSSADGSLKIYSSSKFTLIMDNLNLTNPSGPAVNNQSGSKATVVLPYGSVSTLSDGITYPDTCLSAAGKAEDQNAAFFSRGSLVFSGTGNLNITGRGADKHGLYSKDDIKVSGASIKISSADKDGIHPKDGFNVDSGYVNITSNGDAIDADNGSITISGGKVTVISSASGGNGLSCLSANISNAEVNITVTGDKSKGIKSKGIIALGTGVINIKSAGNTILETSGSGYDPSYAAAVKSDTSIFIDGAEMTIECTGKGGKGISSDYNIIMTGGKVNVTSSGAGATYKNSSGVTDTYHSTCIAADGNISILGGIVTTASSGTAGRGITSDGRLFIGDSVSSPSISVTTTGTRIYISGSGEGAEYDEAKAISSDGIIIINSGTIQISSADDGIKSDTSVTINNGNITITKSVEGIEAQYITVNGGSVNITASDDGINSTKGSGGEFSDGSCIYINGGNIAVSATKGDGLDSNGNIVMTGGTVVVNGPSSAPEVAFDYNGTFSISGGLLIASGPNSGNMIQATSTGSAQYTVKAVSSSMVSSSTIFNIQNSAGTSLVTFQPMRSTYYLVFSSPELKLGSSYSIYTGGTSTGNYANGLYTGGIYSGGTLKKSFTISGKVTSVTF